MSHETQLISTLAVALALALFGGVLAVRLKMPPLIGYLVAGIVVGPFTPGFVADKGLAAQLSEIGVILLMFGVGMHFSIRDLIEVRRIAIPGAIVQILVATAIGVGIADYWGWSFAAGLCFGLSLSVASTVVLLRALEQIGKLDSLNGRIAIGWLVVEDLAMVIALVLLPVAVEFMGTPGVASTGTTMADLVAPLQHLAIVIGKIGLFFVLMYVVGLRVFPWIFAQIAHTGFRELLTLFVIGSSLGIAYGSAELFGVSFALGAFFAGVVINESKLSSRVAAESVPLQNIFTVLFFVSVGMLFDPSILVNQPLQVLAVLGVIVVGKSAAAVMIVLLFGYPLKTALMVAVSLAQIGEFSFILAALGVQLKILTPEAQSLILSGALLSIALNPVLFKLIPPIERLVARHKSLAWLGRLGQARITLSDTEQVIPELHDHVVLVGYGRVGRALTKILRQQDVPLIVIDNNREHVARLRKKRITAISGDAAVGDFLTQARLPQAKLLVLAVSDGFHARRILEAARKIYPNVDTVVRTHSEEEQAFLERDGVGIALMAEQVMAGEMAKRVLGIYRLSGLLSEAR
ncbi:YbaL family putative K(+) efflux transporter [Stenotrophobium rhamnosiphilum]|uniref:Kef family K(+) transporter n=1 Tax=Stenotrophobium rhamnosiphilum TaxID=2029166 RepID=A0A2T5MJ96_9GAMM|nr:YbaL family putative K(+) efflux transporter [Stenotrophobium rhamnosiphilum]PTU32651.1 Kef family K(+) transporter [Stenotrophobium rhamnosiphilum]